MTQNVSGHNTEQCFFEIIIKNELDGTQEIFNVFCITPHYCNPKLLYKIKFGCKNVSVIQVASLN